MKSIEIDLISRHNNRKFKADARFKNDGKSKPVILFNHGFKGFKDWGPFNLIADKFAEAGFVFIKMNFSHNGISAKNSSEFTDLEAFAKNNFCIELDDTGVLIDYLFSDQCVIPSTEIDLDSIYIIGHSRGGASAILKANEDDRIKRLVTWAAVNNLGAWHSKEELDYWKKNGRIYIHNARTNQQMPMDYQLVENFEANKGRLQVPDAVATMRIPMLSIHGSADPTVPVSAVHEIQTWNPNAKIEIIEGAGHTFGGTHPFEGSTLPDDLKKVIGVTVEFYKSIS
jgi:pimeloyl-ACP methyl ester carboxylesterase